MHEETHTHTRTHTHTQAMRRGNEWNYNGLYVGSSFFDCIAKIRDVAKVVRELLGHRARLRVLGPVEVKD